MASGSGRDPPPQAYHSRVLPRRENRQMSSRILSGCPAGRRTVAFGFVICFCTANRPWRPDAAPFRALFPLPAQLRGSGDFRTRRLTCRKTEGAAGISPLSAPRRNIFWGETFRHRPGLPFPFSRKGPVSWTSWLWPALRLIVRPYRHKFLRGRLAEKSVFL